MKEEETIATVLSAYAGTIFVIRTKERAKEEKGSFIFHWTFRTTGNRTEKNIRRNRTSNRT